MSIPASRLMPGTANAEIARRSEGRRVVASMVLRERG